MKTVFLILAFIFSVSILYAQNDHLEPSEDFINQTGVLKDYFKEIQAKLFSDFSNMPVARLVIIPSFDIEYAFSLEEDSFNFVLKTATFNTSYWYAEKKNNVKSVNRTTKIGKVLGESIKRLFIAATNTIKKPETIIDGLDGTTYYFSALNNGKFLTGEKWSPRQGTKMFDLVEICQKIIRYLNQQNHLEKYPTPKVEEQTMILEIDKLIEKLNS